jgi:adenylate kinase family enzyme
MVGYLDFGRYHGKDSLQGSTFIRMKQMEKYWPEFSRYRYGSNPEALVFQKVYCTEDYKFPAHFPGVKILDICDPDWLEGVNIVDTCKSMDAVVTPTEALAEFLRQFHDNVRVIPDRFDISAIPEPKQHTGQAKTVVWFGYSHNATLMKAAMRVIDKMQLNLLIIANDDPFIHQWSDRSYKDFYKFVKYNEDTFYETLQTADFAVMPPGFRPQDAFKSNNKTVKANLAGLPVAVTAEAVEQFMSAEERQKWFDENYESVKQDYDIRNSVAEYKQIIQEAKDGRAT